MKTRLIILWAFVGVFGVCVSGCASDPAVGYSSKSVYPTNVRTVAVPIFASKSYTRDVEFELTDALIKEIESRTPYKVTSEDHADTVILGRIVAIELTRLSKSPFTGLAEEVVVGVTIDFTWKDLRNNRVLVERRAFASHGLFVPSRPSGEPIEIGQFGAVQQLAQDIVGELRSDW